MVPNNIFILVSLGIVLVLIVVFLVLRLYQHPALQKSEELDEESSSYTNDVSDAPEIDDEQEEDDR